MLCVDVVVVHSVCQEMVAYDSMFALFCAHFVAATLTALFVVDGKWCFRDVEVQYHIP